MAGGSKLAKHLGFLRQFVSRFPNDYIMSDKAQGSNLSCVLANIVRRRLSALLRTMPRLLAAAAGGGGLHARTHTGREEGHLTAKFKQVLATKSTNAGGEGELRKSRVHLHFP